MSEERIYYWDNLKCLMIFLVVLGHFLLPVSHNGKGIEVVYYFIYLFHMPAFVFISGFFAKNYLKKDVPVVSKLAGFLLLYLIFKLLIGVLKGVCTGSFPGFNPFREAGAPWYLFALFAWYLLLPLLAKFKGSVCVPILIILGLVIGMEKSVGSLFCLSRIIVFLPFFMAGYYFNKDTVAKLTCVRNKILSVIVLAGITAGILFRTDWINAVSPLIYGGSPYIKLSRLSVTEAMGARLCLYIIAFIMIFAVLCLIPKRRLPISYIGGRTLSIYIVHRLIRDMCKYFGLYDLTGLGGIKLLMFCVILSAVVTWISSAKIFDRIFGSVFRINYSPLLKTGGYRTPEEDP